MPKLEKVLIATAMLLALLLALLIGVHRARAEEPAKPKETWTWQGHTCDEARAWKATHTDDEAQDFVTKYHIPKWVINRAKRLCNL